MEIIEKEKVKEIPAAEYCDRYGYGNRRDVNGKANAGLALGIVGTALGAWALFGNRRAGGFGVAGGLGGGATNINVNGMEGMGGSSRNCPSAYEVQMKECEDVLALQGGLYNWALTQLNQRFQDREVINQEMFGLYKSQVDADFGLYKSTRDGFDVLSSKLNTDAFNLYKSQRDGFDILNKEINDLKCQVAVNTAIRPYQDKLLQCEIAGVKTCAAFEDERIINYVNKLDCRNIKGINCLPNTPLVTGFMGNQCGCNQPIVVDPA